ncbi:Os11g0205200 [Oryza sativa Japonica Group]|uniref:Os11g0205200 protein n=1 Tax=Oryza sativa subsp. japonica TaxID=39947 RepID=C7J952_ORYSJ|nr:Os11g0205200 [Oryza sativa Japonica Group]|eukprot:NP_001176418.1 Os11g0205200 [Oryza sativa Japonica Group]
MELTSEQEQLIHRNAQASNAILSALSSDEFNKVDGLEKAKEMWDNLQLAHEGSPAVREAKIELLEGRLGRFVMDDKETSQQMYDRMMILVNKIKGLGSVDMTNHFVVKRLLCAFGPRNPTLVSMIQEMKDFKRLTPSDILGRIVSHEMQEEEAREVRQMVKNATMIKNQEVALKKKRNLALEESLAKECAKNEQLANELNLANGSLASLRDVNETLQEKFVNLDKSHKDLEVQFDTLWNSTSQPNVVSNSSNPSTSNGYARCYNIDLNSCGTNIDAMQALKKENERLGTLVKYGCMKTYHSKDALYKTITAHPNKDGHGLGFSGGSPVSKRVMVNGKECLMFVREGKAPQESEVTSLVNCQGPGTSGQTGRNLRVGISVSQKFPLGSSGRFARKFRANGHAQDMTGSSGHKARRFRPEGLYYDSYVISKNSEGKVVAYFNGNYNDEYRTCVWVPKALAYSSGGSSWVVDSGCTNHMTGERSMFTSLDEESGTRENIVFGDDGKGKLGYNCLFTDEDVTVFRRDDSSVAFKGKLKGDLYLVDFDVDRVNPEACLIAKSSMGWLWHHRLAHVGMRNLATLLKGEHILGLTNVTFEKDYVCSACQAWKQVGNPHPIKNIMTTTRPLELLHMDLFGPVAYISIGGNKYGFVIVDNFSRFTWVYFLHDKSEAQDVFKRFAKQGQNLYNLTIKRRESSTSSPPPYDPPQNGIVERKNQTLIEAARAMLDEYKTSDIFWAETVSTACHAINRLYLHKILKKTSYELLSGKKPNVSYFRVFGSKCFILSKRPRSSKFSRKVDEGFLLGYESNAHAYHVFNKTSSIVEVTRDVTFDESNGSQGEQVVVHVVDDADPRQAIDSKAIGDIRPVKTQDDEEDRDQPSSSTSNSPTTSQESVDPEVPGPDDWNLRTSPGPEVLGPSARKFQAKDSQGVPTAQVDGIDAEGTVEHPDRAHVPSVHHPRIHHIVQRDHPVDNILGDIRKGLQRGNAIISMSRFDINSLMEAVQRHRVTHLFCVPPVIIALTKHGRAAAIDTVGEWDTGVEAGEEQLRDVTTLHHRPLCTMTREKRQKASQDVSGDESPPIRYTRGRLGKEKVVEGGSGSGTRTSPRFTRQSSNRPVQIRDVDSGQVMPLIQEVAGEVVVAVLGLEGHLMISLENPMVEMKWIDWAYMRKKNNEVFNQVMQVCHNKNLGDILALEYDWNEEVIAQFYATTFFGTTRKGTPYVKWLTEGVRHKISMVQFAEMLGLDDEDLNRPNIHSEAPLPMIKTKFMYAKNAPRTWMGFTHGWKCYCLAIQACSSSQSHALQLASLKCDEVDLMIETVTGVFYIKDGRHNPFRPHAPPSFSPVVPRSIPSTLAGPSSSAPPSSSSSSPIKKALQAIFCMCAKTAKKVKKIERRQKEDRREAGKEVSDDSKDEVYVDPFEAYEAARNVAGEGPSTYFNEESSHSDDDDGGDEGDTEAAAEDAPTDVDEGDTAAQSDKSHLSVMEHLGSSCIVRGRGKNKRIWTYFEDEELIKALFEIALDPSWKSEGGFKNGYCQVLENVLAKKLPSSGLTAVPTKFGTIEVMLTKSGFSWDDNRKMIQCEKQQYDDHCRKNNEAKGLYGVAFPHYDTLAAIYGKDIATREGAEGLGEAVANMEKEIVQDIQDEEDKEDEERVSRETPRRSIDLAAPRRSIDSAAPRRSIDSAAPRRSIDSTASSSKKRKKNSNKLKNTLSSDPFMDVFANVQGDPTDVTKHVGAMVASMQREAEIQEKAMAEEDPLQKIQNEAILECQKLGLTGTEVVNAAAAFVKVPAQMSMLIALPESLRREYVLKILAGNSLDQSCSVATATGNISLYFVIINYEAKKN